MATREGVVDPLSIGDRLQTLRFAAPQAYQAAMNAIASPAGPRGYQQPMVLSACMEYADADGVCMLSEKQLAGVTALPVSQVRNAISHLVSLRWLERPRLPMEPDRVAWGTVKLTARTMGLAT